MSDRPSRIILTGFSGAGKTASASFVANQLGWDIADTDEMVQVKVGKRILEIFRDEGEQRFRDLEVAAVEEACRRENVVVATGGGAILREENRGLMADGGFVVCLEARPETILRRLTAGTRPLDRPLLASEDPLTRIRELKSSRQHLYALCDWTIHTDALTPKQVADEVLRAYEHLSSTALSDRARLESLVGRAEEIPAGTLHAIPQGSATMVHTAGGDYAVLVGWGLLSGIGQRLRESGIDGHAYVISDEAVFHHHGQEIERSLAAAEVRADVYIVPPGEATKSLETASEIYDWLVGLKAERRQAMVALGGGMVTDLAGFVAATYARGVPLVHVPTSLLAMVDAAIGGKVGVNHPRAKNMIGAFYQPRMVIADLATLRTLPPREYVSGWAEVIKHAFIADEDLLAFLEDHAEGTLKLDREITTEAIRRSVAIKARIVSEDEREETGLRTTLNYGHTLAHALESATEYGRFLHGESVAVGMMFAAGISERLGMLPADVVQRQRVLLERFNLPARCEGIDRTRVRAAMALDKKVRGKTIQWVLLEGVGRPVLRDDVPGDLVEQVLSEVLG
jgi:3-dehydroquinate synthase